VLGIRKRTGSKDKRKSADPESVHDDPKAPPSQFVEMTSRFERRFEKIKTSFASTAVPSGLRGLVRCSHRKSRRSTRASQTVLCRPGGLRRGDKTRSHPELGRQTLQRQWYFVSRHGRVGRRQARKEQFPSSPRRQRRPNDVESITPFAAGWSSPVARQAHNLKAAGSNPAPATKYKPLSQPARGLFLRRAKKHKEFTPLYRPSLLATALWSLTSRSRIPTGATAFPKFERMRCSTAKSAL
jgi:hypothetical protein